MYSALEAVNFHRLRIGMLQLLHLNFHSYDSVFLLLDTGQSKVFPTLRYRSFCFSTWPIALSAIAQVSDPLLTIPQFSLSQIFLSALIFQKYNTCMVSLYEHRCIFSIALFTVQQFVICTYCLRYRSSILVACYQHYCKCIARNRLKFTSFRE